MNDDPHASPAASSWRDIAQPVIPRAMSRGGRWRFAFAVARVSTTAALLGAVAWGLWRTAGALRENSRTMPAAARAVAVTRFDFATGPGGVLDEAWLTRTLALPKGAALMELDLGRLRARLLADAQVVSATVARRFPDGLHVRITERSPVARLRVGLGSHEKTYLVARDGVVFAGTNHAPAMLDTLPWLAGFALVPEGAGFRPVAGMAAVSDLLARAQYEAEHLYHRWSHVSLARLEADGELEVTMTDGSVAVFTTKQDYFRQLAKLDDIIGKLAAMPGAEGRAARIDLSLGREVPVMLRPVLAQGAAPRPALPPGFNVFPASSSPHHREL